jgi:hypothetical protein
MLPHYLSVAVQDMGYFKAWESWYEHADFSARTMWGVHMYWWGRFGKILEFLGGSTVIATIVGAKHLAEFRQTLHQSGPKRVAHRLRAPVRQIWVWYRRNDILASAGALFAFFSFCATAFAAVWRLVAGHRIDAGIEGAVIEVVLIGLALMAALPLGLIFLLALMSAVSYALDFVVIRPFEVVLRGATKEWLVQATGLLFLAVGIQFDVLTS